jgi:hypothetical protein
MLKAKTEKMEANEKREQEQMDFILSKSPEGVIAKVSYW